MVLEKSRVHVSSFSITSFAPLNFQSIKFMFLWIWSGLLCLIICWFLFVFGFYIWAIFRESIVSFGIRHVLNFGNCFELLFNFLTYFLAFVLIIFLAFLTFYKTAIAFLLNRVLRHRLMTRTWLIVAVHVTYLFFFIMSYKLIGYENTGSLILCSGIRL
jgi:hypothetical protein